MKTPNNTGILVEQIKKLTILGHCFYKRRFNHLVKIIYFYKLLGKLATTPVIIMLYNSDEPLVFLTLLPQPALLVRVEERVHEIVAVVLRDLERFSLYTFV